MSNKGCNSCAHYKIGEIRMWEEYIPRSCVLGNTEALNKWWEENGHKTGDTTDMPCFEETSGSKYLRDMIELVDRLIKAQASE